MCRCSTAAPGSPTDETVEDTFTYVVSDGDGDTSSADLVIKIQDGVPDAVDDTATAVAEASARPQNIAIVIDRSGSIDSTEYAQELAAVRTFIQTLIDQGNPGNLAFTVVAFSGSATNFGTYLYDGTGSGLDDFDEIGGSENLDDLLTTSGISNTEGFTNFNAALEALFGSGSDFLTNDVADLPGHADRIFFLSDGIVTSGPAGITTANKDNILDNDIDLVPVAIGDGVTPSNFVTFFTADIVASEDDVLTATDFDDLADTLIEGLVSDAVAIGNLLSNDSGGSDGFGAPEPIVQIEHNGIVYTDTSGGGADDGMVEFTTAAGGR